MIQTGKTEKLIIIDTTEQGLILDGQELGPIFLAGRDLSDKYENKTPISVFLYNDSDGQPTATLKTPKIQLGEFAFLKTVSSSRMGAFLNWGLPKDLYVPITEQQVIMEENKSYIIYLTHDKKEKRLIGSSKIDKYLNKTAPPFHSGEQVSLLISRKTDLGYIAIINNSHTGMLYHGEIFSKISTGISTSGFVTKIREDNKIDLRLNAAGYKNATNSVETILQKLKQAGGFLPLNDKSPPKIIYDTFGESKKNFKKAIGSLYRERKISISPEGIHLSKKADYTE